MTGPLTDTQLRATPVPISGPLTDTQLRATAVPVSGTVTATGPLTDTQLRATSVPVAVVGGASIDDLLTSNGVTESAIYDNGVATNTKLDTLIASTATAITSSECVAIIAAGGTTCPAMPTGTYMALMQQRGPNDTACTLGGTAPTLSNGIRMAAQGAAVTDPTDGFGPFPVTNANTAIKCITRTLDQVAGAAVEITYWSH